MAVKRPAGRGVSATRLLAGGSAAGWSWLGPTESCFVLFDDGIIIFAVRIKVKIEA